MLVSSEKHGMYTTDYDSLHLCLEGSPRAQWAIDDVIIAVNDTNSKRFQENFNPMKTNVWYMAMNAVPKITCSSLGNALEFSKNAGKSCYIKGSKQCREFDMLPEVEPGYADS